MEAVGRQIGLRGERAPAGAALDRRSVHPLVRLAFYGFVASIPFEYPDRSIPLEVHTISGALFLAVALLQPRVCFELIPKALGWFGAYLCVYAILGAFTAHVGEVIHLLFNFLLVFFLFWVGYNLGRREAIARTAMTVFVVACVVIALMEVSGIGRSVVEAESSIAARYTVLAQDPNTVGGNLVLAILLLFGLTFGGTTRAPWPSLLIWPPALLMTVALGLTGSRGPMVALCLGLLVFGMKSDSPRLWLRNLAAGVVAVGLFLALSYAVGPMRARMASSFNEGSMAGREQIFPQAWQMFLERPVAGWGPVANEYELADRTRDFEIGKRLEYRKTRDTHNVALEVLTSTGLVGAVLLLNCVLLCLRGAWRARRGPLGVLPLTASAGVVALSASIGLIASKQGWLLLAFGLAAGSRAAVRRARRVPQPAPLLVRPYEEPSPGPRRGPGRVAGRAAPGSCRTEREWV